VRPQSSGSILYSLLIILIPTASALFAFFANKADAVGNNESEREYKEGNRKR